MSISRLSLTNWWLIVVAIGLLNLMSGCFVPLKYDVSVLQEIPAGFEGEIHKDVAELNLPELTLLAQVQSFRWSDSYMIEPLAVWLAFSPLDGPVTLDTRSVTLKSDDDAPLQAISYLGPATPWWSPRAFAAGCGPRIYRTGISITNSGVARQSVMRAGGMQGIYRPSSEAISIESESCFMFWFGTDPLPEHVFVLSITGVTKNGQKILLPDMRFEKATVSTVRGFP